MTLGGDILQRRLLLITFLLLLVPGSVATAQSSTSFVIQRSVMVGGGSADSASYSVTTSIGQPVTDVVTSSSYKVSSGFLVPYEKKASTDNQLWLPIVQN